MQGTEAKALEYLPDNLRSAVIRTSSLYGSVDEIRLRCGRELSLTINGENVLCGMKCSRADLEETVVHLCQGSLYSHADGIREGVITTDCGIRAGVCGRAVVLNDRMEFVRDISSVCIRIPHRIPGAADEVFRKMGEGGVLIFSPPGGGKTTILRELIPLLGNRKRTAVIDTRYELCVDETGGLADIYAGYSRGTGIRSAVRTMSPEVIICDEIMGDEDVKAILEAHGSGVMVCASVHGSAAETLRRDPGIARLLDAGVFPCLYGRKSRRDAWEFIEQNFPDSCGFPVV